MGKNFLILSLLFLSYSFAQKNESFILKSGINTGFYSGKKSNWKGNLSYQLGLSCEIPLSSKFNFSPEINFTRLTASITNEVNYPSGTSNFYTVNENLKTSILSFPLLFDYKLNEKIKIGLGPQFNYLLHIGRERNRETTEISRKYTKTFDFGPSVGVSYQLLTKFSVEARYYIGLNKIDQNPDTFNINADSDIGKMSQISLSAGYKF